ncbi:hypothetical protein ACTHOQ_13990 [Solibacillus silvestris]|uniref:hypothetical protein n=1 Tax=Solibacillus silvestris TaxID=76853 RepID=UPI003F7FFCD4
MDFRLKEVYWKDEDGKHYMLWFRESILGDIKIIGFGVGDSQGGCPKKVELTRKSPTIPDKVQHFIRTVGFRIKGRLQNLRHTRLK